jgi:hypothetical protein
MHPQPDGIFLEVNATPETGMKVTRNLGAYPDEIESRREVKMPPGVGEAILFSEPFEADKLPRDSECLYLFESRGFIPETLSLHIRSEAQNIIMKLEVNRPNRSVCISLDTSIIVCPLNAWLNPNNPENFIPVPVYVYETLALIGLYFHPNKEALDRFLTSVTERLHLMGSTREVFTSFPIDPWYLPRTLKEDLDLLPEFRLGDFYLEIVPTRNGSTFKVRVKFTHHYLLKGLTKTASCPEELIGFSGQPEDPKFVMENFLFGRHCSEVESDTGPLSHLVNLNSRILEQSASDFIITLHKSRGGIHVLLIRAVFDEPTVESTLELRLKFPGEHTLLTWADKGKMPLIRGGLVGYYPEELGIVYSNPTKENVDTLLQLLLNLPEYRGPEDYPQEPLSRVIPRRLVASAYSDPGWSDDELET